jgi:energy-coupling factor transporter ATP-binding protein EcfA2
VIELRLEAVTFGYPGGETVLGGLDLDVPSGQSVAFIGANGSGKTTLLRHLDGLLRPTSGRVLLDGQDATDLRVAELARLVGLGFQDPERQIFNSDVRSEVEFGARRLGASSEEAFVRAREALEAVGLGDDLGRHPDDLGEAGRKLLTIASVLAMGTPIVALDEPTTGLDRGGVARVAQMVTELQAEGRTVIAASHDMRFVAETFERVVLLDGGHVRLDGPPITVFAEDAWPTLRSAGVEPPESAILGSRLGLGSTPTDTSLVAAIRDARD